MSNVLPRFFWGTQCRANCNLTGIQDNGFVWLFQIECKLLHDMYLCIRRWSWTATWASWAYCATAQSSGATEQAAHRATCQRKRGRHYCHHTLWLWGAAHRATCQCKRGRHYCHHTLWLWGALSPPKAGLRKLCQMLADFHNYVTAWLIRKFAIKFSLNIKPHLTNVDTLPCETLMSENSDNVKHVQW